MIVDNQSMHLSDSLAWPLLPPTMPTAPRQREHVAIVTSAMANLIETGAKTIESRLSKVRGPAFDQVHAGDVIYFREAGGGFRVSAKVGKALHVRELSLAGLTAIREVFGEKIGADAAYWRSRRGSRYATLIWLTEVRANLEGPALWRWPGFRDRSAWGTRALEPQRIAPSRLPREQRVIAQEVSLRRRA
jgi:ASC-1-like (ASCH) protein